MATFDLLVTYPDAEQPRIIAALKARYTDASGNVPTTAQAIEAFRQSTLAALRDIVLKYEKDAAQQSAVAGVVPVNPS